MAWRRGDVIVRRDMRGDRPWLAVPVVVVSDEPDLLVSYTPEGAPFGFVGDDHPWFGRERWTGHGALELQRPGRAHAVWVFWEGPKRQHAAWYFNLQAPFKRTPIGFDTSDQVLDLWLEPGGTWHWKDVDEFERHARDGRFTPGEAAAIRAEGERVAARLDRGERWWDERWASWEPDPGWPIPELLPGWDRVA
jgi:hypothetical protein